MGLVVGKKSMIILREIYKFTQCRIKSQVLL